MNDRNGIHGSRRRLSAGFLLMLAGIFALSGCSSMNVYSDFDPAADFAKLETWDWAKDAAHLGGDPRLENALVRGPIETAISDELLRRNFHLAIQSEPDFLIAYHVALNQKLDMQIVNDSYGYAYQGTYGATWGPAAQDQAAVPQEYEQGTLVLDILDAGSKQLVWRGTVEAKVYPDLEPRKREERIRDAVQQLLSQFPPR